MISVIGRLSDWNAISKHSDERNWNSQMKFQLEYGELNENYERKDDQIYLLNGDSFDKLLAIILIIANWCLLPQCK